MLLGVVLAGIVYFIRYKQQSAKDVGVEKTLA